MNVLSTLKVMPETKAEIKLFGDSLINSIQFGDINPLELDGRLKAMEELIKHVRSSQELIDGLLIESDKYNQKSFEEGNFKYQVKEVGTKYDFSECDDQEWIETNEKIKELSEAKKERETLLKSIRPDTVIFGNDGIQLHAPSKTSTTKVITLLK